MSYPGLGQDPQTACEKPPMDKYPLCIIRYPSLGSEIAKHVIAWHLMSEFICLALGPDKRAQTQVNSAGQLLFTQWP